MLKSQPKVHYVNLLRKYEGGCINYDMWHHNHPGVGNENKIFHKNVVWFHVYELSHHSIELFAFYIHVDMG